MILPYTGSFEGGREGDGQWNHAGHRVPGNKPPTTVAINEMTTVATVWTHAQVLDGTVIKGPALSLRIAAGNVPNFVAFTTGGWAPARFLF